MPDDEKIIAVCDNGAARPLNVPTKLETVGSADLSAMQLDPPRFVVQNLITGGLNILASPPKYGKSWLMLDLSYCVATGSNFLGRKTEQSKVLYCALEDSFWRIDERMKKILNGQPPSNNLRFAIEAADLEHGLIQTLENFVSENPGTGLIIIDTFQKVRNGGARGESAYAADYREAGIFKNFADKHKLAIVLVHHTRKLKDPSDPFSNVSGTAGLTAAADTMLVLSRNARADEETTLSVTGRDVEMQEYQMKFQKTTCKWQILGSAEELMEQRKIEEYNNNPVVLTIRKLVEESESWLGKASEIISASRYFDTPIKGDVKVLGREISKYEEMLFYIDKISCGTKTNGSGGRTYIFKKVNRPQNDAAKANNK